MFIMIMAMAELGQSHSELGDYWF